MNTVPKTKYFARMSADFLVIFFCFFVTRFIYRHDEETIFDLRSFGLLGYMLSAWYFSAKFTGLFNGFLERLLSAEWVILFRTYLIHCVAIIAAMYFLSKNPVHNKWFLVFFEVSLFFFLLIEKYLLRWYLGSKFVEKRKTPLVIVGAGEQGMRFYQKVVMSGAYNYKLVGFVDDEKQPQLNGSYLGTIDQFDSYFDHHSDVDEIIVALPNKSTKKIKQVVRISEKNAVRVRVVPDYFEYGDNVHVSNMASIPVISLRNVVLEDNEIRVFKRIFDIVFSLFVIVFVFSWLFPLLAILIKAESRGPVFFKQLRSGYRNHQFMCFKFRSMRINNLSEEKQVQKGDVRTTKIGRFIRKTSLDEFPQFFNVLIGNMSVVGPRPHMIEHTEKYSELVDQYMIRHFAKPGITGWAQVNGYRGETKDPAKMQGRINHDIWYIENWSLWLDMQIILQTVINVFKGEENAY